MSKKKRKAKRGAASNVRAAASWLCSPDAWHVLTGYTPIASNPEVQTAIKRVADLVSSMTIHLLENSKDGDKRIKNELSRKIDITPCKYMTRKAFIEKIVKDLILGGNSYVMPHFNGGLLDDLEPLPAAAVSILDEGYGYSLQVLGQRFEYDELLHFTYCVDPDRPWVGEGQRVLLKEVAKQLSQARKTSQSIMESPMPSIVVKVDGLTEEYASKAGRAKLAEQFISSSDAGQPWFIPAEAFSVEQVKPFSLNDLAIIDSISIDKRTAAAIIGVPAFLVGVGDFNASEYNNFIRVVVLPIARSIEQELTRKLLLSPNWFFRFNPRSLYSYSITELAEVNCEMVDRAIIDRNEARDALGYTPREGLSELAILENYIPMSKIGDQKKLKGEAANGTQKQPEE